MPSNNPNENVLDHAQRVAENLPSPTGVEFLDNLFYPNLRQEVEFGQQVALQEHQNYVNSAQARMADAKAAGINLNTAASGIVGNNGAAGASGTPPSSIGAGAQTASALGSIAQGVGEGAAAAGQIVDNFMTLHPRRRDLLSRARKQFADAGFTDTQSKLATIALKYADKNAILGIITAWQNLKNMRADYNVAKARVDEINKTVEHFDALIEKYRHENNLNDALATEAEKNAALAEARATMQNFHNDIAQRYHVDTTQPLQNMLVEAMLADDHETAEKIMDSIYNYNYESEIGMSDAEVDTAFEKAYNEEAARVGVQNESYEWRQQILLQRDIISAAYKYIMQNPNDIKGLVAKMFNIWSVAAGKQIESFSINRASKGSYTPRYNRRAAAH